MKINDNRKPPYQTTLAPREMQRGRTYELVQMGEKAITSDHREGDVFIAGARHCMSGGLWDTFCTNLRSGDMLTSAKTASDGWRFVPVDAEVTVK